MDNKNEINEQIIDLQKSNSRNNKMIIILSAVLVFVCVVAIYVRFFS